MKDHQATMWGFAIAALLPAVVLATGDTTFGDNLVGKIFSYIVAYYYSCGAAAAFGFPLFLAAKKRAIVHWWSSAIGGGIAGSLVAITLRIPEPVNLNDLSIDAPLGIAAGIVFWVIWRTGRADRTRIQAQIAPHAPIV